MKFYKTINLDVAQKVLEQIKILFPDIKNLNYDGQFTRVRESDLDSIFGNNVFIEKALPPKQDRYWESFGSYIDDNNNFIEKQVNDFFKSEKGNFNFTGTDLAELFSPLGRDMIMADTTKEQGYDFGKKLIDTHQNTPHRDYPIIIFDPLIEIMMNPFPYLEGLNKAHEDLGKLTSISEIYLFAGRKN